MENVSDDVKSIFDLDERQTEKKPSIIFTLIEEPKLKFANEGTFEDPKTGIRNFGPFSYSTPQHPKEIKVGFIGTSNTIKLAKEWCEKCTQYIKRKETDLPRLFQDFEGVNDLFKSQLVFADHWNSQINNNEISRLLQIPKKSEGFEVALELLSSKVRYIAEQDDKPDILIVCLPEEIEAYYKTTGEDRSNKRVRLTKAEKKLLELLKRVKNNSDNQRTLGGGTVEIPSFAKSPTNKNLRRAFKAAVMKYNIPTQILLPSKLHSSDSNEDDATKAWNFCTAIYYKAGGIPWNIDMERGTCFVGVGFYKQFTETSFSMQTSLAQVFTDRGDFLVLRGAKINWDLDKGRSPHLTYEAARDLVKLVLDKYKERNGSLPRRVVIHKTSKYWPDELKGFLEPLKDIEQYDLVALYSSGIRFFRSGAYPVVKGTYCSISDQAHFIFTQGYVPYLETYPKSHVPEPLEIVQHIGDSTKKSICEEIIGLSKMNWNTSEFSSKLPITLSFADKVGEILSYVPENADPNPLYKFYM